MRLILTKPKICDVPELFEFLGDPLAMSQIHCDKSFAECRRRIAVHEWKRRHNDYAHWVIRQKGGGKVIGWGGLYDDPFDPGWRVELACYFHPKVWENGFGTVLCRVALKVANEDLRMSRVSAFAHPDNKAFINLLKIVGFEYVEYVTEMARNLYSRTRHS